MTITTNTKNKNIKMGSEPLKACLVTDQIALSKNILNHWQYSDLRVRNRIADLISSKDCELYIIDTKTKDMDIWPEPFLADPNADSKVWLFLLSNLEDANRLQLLPAKAKFFNRSGLELGELFRYLQKRFDANSGKTIEEVNYLDGIRSFFVRMGNDKSYVLELSELPEADTSKVTKCRLADDHSHFRVVQQSGNWFEVPWDDVLYHCEPEYTYFKGKQKMDKASNTEANIGEKIKQLRVARGYSIEGLAQKAGMKRPNLSRLENGKHQPSLGTLEKLAEALGINVAEILT
jgi:ribosome-binding protein aMBF1 (putative translation factor)